LREAHPQSSAQLLVAMHLGWRRSADAEALKPPLAGLTEAGREAIARNPACADFYAKPHVASVAVVGNGPLTRLQKIMIAESDLVMRFNKMDNRCHYGPPVSCMCHVRRRSGLAGIFVRAALRRLSMAQTWVVC
jgi:hypothetical protein